MHQAHAHTHPEYLSAAKARGELMSTMHLPLMAMGLGGVVASPLPARKQADVAVPSLQDQLAITVFRQVIEQMDASDLYGALGSQRVCDLVKHLLKTTEGRNLMLTCAAEPSCQSSWQGLDRLENVSYEEDLPFDRGYLEVRLARKQSIYMKFIDSDFRARGTLFVYALPTQAQQKSFRVTDASQLAVMYAKFKGAGVTDQEIGCLLVPLLEFCTRIKSGAV